MIIFAIPLRSKGSSKNWEEVTLSFNNTLHSIFNQTSKEFKVIVACNEIPKLDVEYDDRLEFISLDIPIPNSWIEMARDKFWKLTVIAVRIHQILIEQENPEDGIYVMPVDADDLLNCHIAQWCDKHPNEFGAVSDKGYVWDNNGKFLSIYSEMHTYCGSCNIIKMYREDLPEKLPVDSSMCHDKETAGILNKRYPIRYDHNTVVERYDEMGKPFARLPFYSTIYVRKTEDNISKLYQRENGIINNDRFHPIAFLRSLNIFKYKLINRQIRKEFGICDKR